MVEFPQFSKITLPAVTFASVTVNVLVAVAVKVKATGKNLWPLTQPAFKLLTSVVEVMTSGAVPDATVLVYCPVEERVVKAPAALVVPPIAALSIVPPLIAGEVNVLLVSVSVVARPTRVSVAVGKVSVPVLEIVEITGEVKVLFVKVCVPVSVATTAVSMLTVPVAVIGLGTEVKPFPAATEVTVPEPAGAAQVWSPRRKVVLFAVPDPNRAVPTVPVLIASAVIELVAGSEIVLLVKVSVVARPTKVSVAVGKVKVPVLEIVEITGEVNVLFVSV